MENNNYLGIYLRNDCAFVTVVTHEGDELLIKDRFQVSLSEPVSANKSYGELIREQLNVKQIKWAECAVSLDCSCFTQHNLFSRFTDVKQISQTIISDAEDEIGSDVESLAVTFNITKKNDNGSRATVYAVKKSVLKDIVTDLNAFGLDPITVEPDGVCLARSISRIVKTDNEAGTMFTAFTEKNCYLLATSKDRNQVLVRSFLYNKDTDMARMLAREINMTKNQPGIPEVITKVYSGPQVEPSDLSDNISIDVDGYAEDIEKFDRTLSQDPAYVAYMIAAGAAMINFIRTPKIDFRKSYLPYQGKKAVVEKMLRLICVALGIVVFAFSIYSTLLSVRYKMDLSQIRSKTQKQYSAALKGRKTMGSYPLKDLETELNKLQKVKSGKGFSDDDSVPGRLMQILESLNGAPANIKLKVNSISISSASIRIDGSTESRQSTNILLGKIKENPRLKVGQVTQKQVGPEDTFIIVIEPVK